MIDSTRKMMHGEAVSVEMPLTFGSGHFDMRGTA
jgi:hypothetical protein